jgi:hypothetical protein
VGWAGWAAAALLAVAWSGSSMREAAPAPAGGPVARGDAGPGAPADELSASLQLDDAAPGGPRPRFTGDASSDVRLASDQFVSELPMQVVETRPAEDGSGYDVLYVRRLLQRARVGSVYSLGLDEQGQPAPVAVDPALLASADSL